LRALAALDLRLLRLLRTRVLSGRSYPSAHASTSFAGARALAAAELPSAPLHAVAISRLYLGVHYPSDVVAGAFLGDAVARLMTR
jgi:membrane-associated phospholipid phosphatase